MALDREGYEEQIARHERTEREARGDFWRDMGRTALHLALSVAVGAGIMGYALHTTSVQLGTQLWSIGQLAWMAGVAWSLLAAYRRGHERGDW